MIMRFCITVLLSLVLSSAAQDSLGGAADIVNSDTVVPADSSMESALSGTETADTLSGSVLSEGMVGDSAVGALSAPDVQNAPLVDSVMVAAPENSDEKSGIKKIKLIKREYNYGQQLRLAIGMMAFLAVVMMSSQNWNPK